MRHVIVALRAKSGSPIKCSWKEMDNEKRSLAYRKAYWVVVEDIGGRVWCPAKSTRPFVARYSVEPDEGTVSG